MKTVAKVLVYNPDGNILVLRRSTTHPRFAYHLDFPGGEVEADEPAEQTISRELREETGLEIDVQNVRPVYEQKVNEKLLYLIYETKLPELPQVTVSWEHDQYYWLSAAALLSQNLPPAVDAYYAAVIEYLRVQIVR